ncbi:MAG: mannosyl-3-phosphoglycerate synthase [Desulfurococcales archaeon]|nr:mannosyl-3-phosphoglycerate synthase [Desulfurococcales archaeon]
MLIEYPYRFENYGAVRIHETINVLEIDSTNHRGFRGVYSVTYDAIEEYAHRTAIVIPVKNEDILTLEGVISAIPHASLVILISASSRSPVDIYRQEVDLARSIHENTRRPIIVAHQRDPVWGEVLRGTPLEDMLDEDGLVRYGKGEGMLLAAILAAGLGYNYVGYIDSDNYVPGSAHEYSWIYYGGFSLNPGPYVMVRIKWPYKGKLVGGTSQLYLRRRGRVSRITNAVLNHALSIIRKIETDIISTANSGEHAMSTRLALNMKWAGGFAIESYQLVYLLESCFLGLDDGQCRFLPEGVTLYQIQSRNPHIHAERDDEHIVDMVVKSLSTIYYSRLNNEDVTKRIRSILESYNWDRPLPKPRIYDPRGIDPEKITTYVISNSMDIHFFEER